jgi:hypothetical protein
MDVESYEDLTAPIPLLWWSQNARLGTKGRCRSQLALAQSTADTFSTEYVEALVDKLPDRDESQDRLHTTWAGTYEAIRIGHRSVLEHLLELTGDIDPRFLQWLERSPEDASDLLSWYLIYAFFAAVLADTIVTDALRDEPGEPISHPEIVAVPNADVATVMLKRADYPAESSAVARRMARTRKEQWGPPPWKL